MAKKIDWDEMKIERRERADDQDTAVGRIGATLLTGIFVVPLWLLTSAVRYDYRWGLFGRDTDDRLAEGSDALGWPEWTIGIVFWLVLVPGIVWLVRG
jgi:hypothetical protein